MPFSRKSADIPVVHISADIPLAHISASESLRRSFETAYRTRFTYVHPNTEIEVVAMRVRGEIPPPKIEFPDITNSGRSLDPLTCATTRIQVDGKWLDAPVFDRSLLPIDYSIKGPSLVVEDFATLYLPPDSSMHLDRKGHARITT